MDFFDKTLKSITHLIYLLVKTANSEDKKSLMINLVTDLIKQKPTSVTFQDSLLHMCVTKSNTIRSSYFIDEDAIVSFFLT